LGFGFSPPLRVRGKRDQDQGIVCCVGRNNVFFLAREAWKPTLGLEKRGCCLRQCFPPFVPHRDTLIHAFLFVCLTCHTVHARNTYAAIRTTIHC
jgi:hypothetical protein